MLLGLLGGLHLRMITLLVVLIVGLEGEGGGPKITVELVLLPRLLVPVQMYSPLCLASKELMINLMQLSLNSVYTASPGSEEIGPF